MTADELREKKSAKQSSARRSWEVNVGEVNYTQTRRDETARVNNCCLSVYSSGVDIQGV